MNEVLISGLVKKLCNFQAKALITCTSKKGQKQNKNQTQLRFF